MDTSTAVTYRSTDMNLLFNISETVGNKVKVFLWNSKKSAPLIGNKELLVVAE